MKVALRYLEIYQSAMDLYGLIHARFILSPRGLALMREKYMLGTFGTCQRVFCERQFVLPIGLSEELSTSRVKVSLLNKAKKCRYFMMFLNCIYFTYLQTYCPRCQEVYVPKQKHLDIDGAYFGTSFPHVYLKVRITKSHFL